MNTETLTDNEISNERCAEEVGWKSDDDAVAYIMEMRRNEH